MLLFLAQGVRDLNSPTRNCTRAPCSGSAESKPLDHQGIPPKYFLSLQLLNCILW